MNPHDKKTKENISPGLGFGKAMLGERPVVTVDYELYEHYLGDSDLTEEQKREFLQHLWNLICEFVSLGWGVHPVQQALAAKEGCGKQPETFLESAGASLDAVHCLDKKFIEQFTTATDPKEGRSGKGVQT